MIAPPPPRAQSRVAQNARAACGSRPVVRASSLKLPGDVMTATSESLIAWGDCDAAGIVYYPRFFHFMDIAFQTLMRKADLNHRILLRQFGVRVPIVDANAKFLSPASYEDRLVVNAEIAH